MLLVLLTLSIGLAQAAIVSIPELGDVEGSTTTTAWTNRTIFQFFSIRYAMPPSGNRRFLPPEPVKSWDGIYDATKQGRGCPEILGIADLIKREPIEDVEDCLTLDVYTPKVPTNNAKNGMPVMIYIYGGGFTAGSSKLISPNYLLDHDIILVAPQYRLGPLGFLSLHTDGIPGNVGLMDQVEALRWVNKYIKHFGGDENRVTIFGHSAGACSIAFHMISPLVEPNLFQRAIIQSGSAVSPWAIEKDPIRIARKIYGELTSSNDSVVESTMETAFKNATVVQIFQATLANSMKNYRSTNFKLIKGFLGRAVIQQAGKVKYLTKSPSEYFHGGEYKSKPIMIGVSKNEGAFMIQSLMKIFSDTNLLEDENFLRNEFTETFFKFIEIEEVSGTFENIVKNKYFKQTFDKPNFTFCEIAPYIADMMGTFVIKGPTFKHAKINSNYAKTYLYSFDYNGENTRFEFKDQPKIYPYNGEVTHGDDLNYLFPYENHIHLNDNDTAIAKLMCELWTNFAKDGKPSSSLLNVDWLPMKKNHNGPYLHINTLQSISDDFVDKEYKTVHYTPENKC